MSQIAFKAPWGAIRGLQFGNVNSKQKVICLHGWQDNCGLFRPMLTKMDQQRHYIALDLMGMRGLILIKQTVVHFPYSFSCN